MQYVACRFSPMDSRRYTYHNDGEPLAVGDFVKVAARGSDTRRVEVMEIISTPPKFDTKPVLGKAEAPTSGRK